MTDLHKLLRECRSSINRTGHYGVMEGCPSCEIIRRIDAALAEPLLSAPVAPDCNCHPEDYPPVPCQHKRSYSECMRAALASAQAENRALRDDARRYRWLRVNMFNNVNFWTWLGCPPKTYTASEADAAIDVALNKATTDKRATPRTDTAFKRATYLVDDELRPVKRKEYDVGILKEEMMALEVELSALASAQAEIAALNASGKMLAASGEGKP